MWYEWALWRGLNSFSISFLSNSRGDALSLATISKRINIIDIIPSSWHTSLCRRERTEGNERREYHNTNLSHITIYNYSFAGY
jgi:hypothetical protein